MILLSVKSTANNENLSKLFLWIFIHLHPLSFRYLPLSSFCALGKGIYSYYTVKNLGILSPILSLKMGGIGNFFCCFSYWSIYFFRSFRFSTRSFLIASEMWSLTVFAEIFKCFAISWVVQPRAASMAIANSVVVKSSATSWPVMGLWTLRQPEEKR